MSHFTHSYLPQAVRTTAALLRMPSLDPTCKGRLLEAVTLYGRLTENLPDERIRFRGRNVTIRWNREQWSNLFVKRISETDCLFVYYHPEAIWIYRGRYEVEGDIFGDQCVVCHDALRFSVPVWSKFSVDSRKELAENATALSK